MRTTITPKHSPRTMRCSFSSATRAPVARPQQAVECWTRTHAYRPPFRDWWRASVAAPKRCPQPSYQPPRLGLYTWPQSVFHRRRHHPASADVWVLLTRPSHTQRQPRLARHAAITLVVSDPVPVHPLAHTRSKPSVMDDRAVPEWDPSPTTTNDSRAVPESSIAVPALFFSPPLPHYFFSPTRPVESCVVSSSPWTPDVAAPKRKRGRAEGGAAPVKRQCRATDGRGVKMPLEVASKRSP